MAESTAQYHRELLAHTAWVRRLAANLAADSDAAEDL